MNDTTPVGRIPACPKRTKAIEQIALTILTLGLRKVAFGSAELDTGTAETARQVADVAARAGRRTLVLDVAGTETGPTWMPGGAAAAPVRDPDGGAFDVASSPNSVAARAAYNDQMRVSAALDRQFADYDLLILSLGGLSEVREDRINAVAAAAASDGIVVVCATNETTTAAMQDAMDLVSAAGGKVVGCVMEDRSNPILADQMATSLERLLWIVPPFARWLTKRVKRSTLLKTPIYP